MLTENDSQIRAELKLHIELKLNKNLGLHQGYLI